MLLIKCLFYNYTLVLYLKKSFFSCAIYKKHQIVVGNSTFGTGRKRSLITDDIRKMRGETIMGENNVQEEKLRQLFDSLSDDQKEKIKKCKTPEEVLELIKSEGLELSDEAMEMISAGIVPVGNNPNRYVLHL